MRQWYEKFKKDNDNLDAETKLHKGLSLLEQIIESGSYIRETSAMEFVMPDLTAASYVATLPAP